MLSSSSSVGSVNLNYYDLDNVLTPPETEHNWAAKETAMKNLGAACHSGIAQNHEYIQFIKNHRKAFAESVSHPARACLFCLFYLFCLLPSHKESEEHKDSREFISFCLTSPLG